MRYCWKCGAKLKEEDKFCYACGTPVTKVVKEELSVSADNLIEKVKELLHEGNVTRIIVKDEKGKVLLENTRDCGSYRSCSGSLACSFRCNICFGYEL